MARLDQRIDDKGNVVSFRGFSRQGLAFLKSLKRNNRRNWFQPRKAQYEDLLVKPMRALVMDLGDRLEKKIPGVRFDPKRAVFRIYRDTRFSADKTPYKTHIAAHMSFSSTDDTSARPGFYVHVEPGEVYIGGGLYRPSAEQLKKVRLRINDDPQAFIKLVKSPAIKKTFGGMSGERLKRAPKGWPSDHPYLEYLQMKQFFAGKEFKGSIALEKDFAAQAAIQLATLIPLMKWLGEVTR